ncbi:ImmA/IrrE family metallo-endopeptidase [Bacillus haynesii]|uniref:ImmA/IrrE family metallo-endopeptidase n=1 Tax=Bacillus haynesii TaxID=1925021 RepID=UPI00227FB868|nr:ImmA/IrrE family metallo-endopeptidase [Bacillus haynesii]MCY8010348.1 ImmA/IrrE family metallo-endopeptidase [Bacillus haynesii]MCY9217341.1 ImmA/IrrE family metallo-endopeptidase [Bacillus haynesii]
MKKIMRHTTHLEDWIESFYRKINILYPHELDAVGISQRIGLKVEFMKMTSRYFNGVIILDSRLSPPKQWQEFGHELCHALRHEGNQLTISPLFAELQEMQGKCICL